MLNIKTYLQLEELLLTPDPADLLPPRRYRVTQPGDPNRRTTVLLPLLTRWAQTRFVDRGPDPYIGRARTESETLQRELIRARRAS